MTILRPNLSTQTITIIPRYNIATGTLSLLNEETQFLNELGVEPTFLNGYLTMYFELTVKEAESFDLELKDDEGNLVFRGKAFATNTIDLENYKLSNGLMQ
jgi:hypothetical protein